MSSLYISAFNNSLSTKKQFKFLLSLRAVMNVFYSFSALHGGGGGGGGSWDQKRKFKRKREKRKALQKKHQEALFTRSKRSHKSSSCPETHRNACSRSV